MVYILNTEIPNKKSIYIALQFIFGIGKKKSINICDYFGISKKINITTLTLKKKDQVILFIENSLRINEDLKQNLTQIKEQSQRLKTYKGVRSRLKLPRRGQRTHTNSKTVKKLNN